MYHFSNQKLIFTVMQKQVMHAVMNMNYHMKHECTIWVRSWNCGCLVTWFCYQLIAKPGNKTAAVSWPDPLYKSAYCAPDCNFLLYRCHVCCLYSIQKGGKDLVKYHDKFCLGIWICCVIYVTMFSICVSVKPKLHLALNNHVSLWTNYIKIVLVI